ncbi:hypothetical protein [Chitinophaga sp. CB10]|uniref:hypothetical protein n=1 Tax=Chitinophaga sp. CB10 TaxID=1891659 RepID=UPI0025BFCF9D|nr:hypothetical protein [Chitinophaga sp. CB10]
MYKAIQRFFQKRYIRKWQKYYASIDKKGEFIRDMTEIFGSEEIAREMADRLPPVMVNFSKGVEFPMWEPVKRPSDGLGPACR